MEIRDYTRYDAAEILPLYEAVGWTNYTGKPQMVEAAFKGALLVLGAYEEGELAGFLRAVGDGASILYIQDIVVSPDFQRRGIGTALLNATLERYPEVYQTVLLTEDTEKTVAFYRANGFVPARDWDCCAFFKQEGTEE